MIYDDERIASLCGSGEIGPSCYVAGGDWYY